jgi:hypothetical protein
MSRDRYLKIILTIIALELGWIAIKDAAPVQVLAQQNQPLTPVVIRGIDLPCQGGPSTCRDETLPVSIMRASNPLRVTADQPLQVDARGIIRVRADQPMIVETRERPLLIQSVPATSAPKPGIP